MTPELLGSKHKEIEAAAEREKNGVKFIIDCIEQDEERMREVLLTDEEKVGDELSIARLLFERAAQILDTIDAEFTAPFGARVVRFAPDGQYPSEPSVALGWERYVLFSYGEDEVVPGKVYAHGIQITASGLGVINGLRDVQGDMSAEQQRLANREAWEAASTK